jgi:ATP-binding cassette subfamily B protein
METVSKRNKFVTMITGVQSILIAMLQISVMIFTLHLWREGTYNIADFTVINGLVMRFIYKIKEAPEIISSMEESIAELDESAQKIYGDHDVDDNSDKKIDISTGEINFKEVVVNYDSKLALSVDSISIPSGQSVALVGRSGAGKTTFVNSIIRLFDVKSGMISIDGQDISAYSQDSLRGQIAYISQTPMLFHRSFFENIAYGKISATRDEVIKAAKQANIHEDILASEDGYDTLVGERGVKLSGGQRQRIAIARAFLKDSKILILDEATSALDAESERLIQESFDNLSRGKTTLVVAHRLSTIKNVDRVLVFDDGKIIEDGNHSELKSLKNGVFKKLWDLQDEAF